MRLVLLFVFLTGLLSATGHAADISGSRDYPLIKRYEGAAIVAYERSEFDAYGLFVRPAKVSGGKAKNTASQQPLEGRVYNITYAGNKGRSSLEVFRNYQVELAEKGFKILWSCSNKECGGRNFNHAVVPYLGGFSENYKDQRYLAAHLQRAEGDVYISLYVVRNYSEGGRRKNMIFTRLDIIELKPMQQRMIEVDAAAMTDGLDKKGHIALYGIYFDSGKAVVKASSEPTLKEIVILLKATPKLKLLVVGHTDNQGSMDYNRQLSRQRAKAVVKALSKGHGIDRNRLKAEGVGFLAPVANNKTAEGRALNRRVELIHGK